MCIVLVLQEAEETGHGDICISGEAQKGQPAQMFLAQEVLAVHAERRKLQAELEVRMCPCALCMCLHPSLSLLGLATTVRTGLL